MGRVARAEGVCPGLAVQLFGDEMIVQPNHEGSAGLRTLEPGKSALRLLLACLLPRREMPTNPNACQSKCLSIQAAIKMPSAGPQC